MKTVSEAEAYFHEGQTHSIFCLYRTLLVNNETMVDLEKEADFQLFTMMSDDGVGE